MILGHGSFYSEFAEVEIVRIDRTNLIQDKYPGYTRKEAFDLVMGVRDQNGGKLVGLRRKKFLFFLFFLVIFPRRIVNNKLM